MLCSLVFSLNRKLKNHGLLDKRGIKAGFVKLKLSFRLVPALSKNVSKLPVLNQKYTAKNLAFLIIFLLKTFRIVFLCCLLISVAFT